MLVFVQVLLLLPYCLRLLFISHLCQKCEQRIPRSSCSFFLQRPQVGVQNGPCGRLEHQILNAFFSQFILVRLPAQSMLLLLLLHLLPYNRQTEATQLLQQYLFPQNVVSHVHSHSIQLVHCSIFMPMYYSCLKVCNKTVCFCSLQ